MSAVILLVSLGVVCLGDQASASDLFDGECRHKVMQLVWTS